MRRALCLLVVAAALIAAAIVQASAPPGPRLAFVRITFPRNSASSSDLLTSGPGGGVRQLVTGNSVPGGSEPGGLAWSPDGQTLAVAEESDLYLVAGDGTGLRRLTDLGNAIGPVFSIDGKTIFFSRYKVRGPVVGASIWAIDTDGAGLRQLTALRRLTFDSPASTSPAGDALAFSRVRCRTREAPSCGLAARLLSLSSGAERLLVRKAVSPIFSPDGSMIALISFRDRNGEIQTRPDESDPASELYVLDTAAGRMRRLTRTKDIAERAPSWDPSGQRIAFERQGPRPSRRIMEVNADGSCKKLLFKKQVRSNRLSYEFFAPAWQPGPGREAGRIVC